MLSFFAIWLDSFFFSYRCSFLGSRRNIIFSEHRLWLHFAVMNISSWGFHWILSEAYNPGVICRLLILLKASLRKQAVKLQEVEVTVTCEGWFPSPPPRPFLHFSHCMIKILTNWPLRISLQANSLRHMRFQPDFLTPIFHVTTTVWRNSRFGLNSPFHNFALRRPGSSTFSFYRSPLPLQERIPFPWLKLLFFFPKECWLTQNLWFFTLIQQKQLIDITWLLMVSPYPWTSWILLERWVLSLKLQFLSCLSVYTQCDFAEKRHVMPSSYNPEVRSGRFKGKSRTRVL